MWQQVSLTVAKAALASAADSLLVVIVMRFAIGMEIAVQTFKSHVKILVRLTTCLVYVVIIINLSQPAFHNIATQLYNQAECISAW